LSFPHRVMIVAGEASGDLHAANLARELVLKAPDTQLFGMGGPKMREAGVELLVDSSRLAVVGFLEVLAHYREISAALNYLRSELSKRRPNLLILVDYVEFNLRLAAAAKRIGVKVLFYVSPQVWAWRPRRVKKIGACIDMMAVLFPFEAHFYERHGIPVRYVGHPLLDQARPQLSREEALKIFGLDPSRPIVGILPGSRRSEIKRLLPLMLDTADQLRLRHPGVQFLMPLALSLSQDDIQGYDPQAHAVKVILGQSYDVMSICDALLVASGTATLEAALIGTPMVIVYKVAPLNYWIMKHLILIEHVGLANIVAGRELVKEFIQNAAQPDILTEEVGRLIEDADYNGSIRASLAEVRAILERPDDHRTVADLALEILEG
jgi:lipid-A-disaccharide synthase